MDSFKAAMTIAAQWTWTAILATARFTWTATLWTATATWATLRWAGRVTLWVVCWPIALYRSHTKKTERRHREIVAAMKP